MPALRHAACAERVLDARDAVPLGQRELRGVVDEAVVTSQPLDGDTERRRGAERVVDHFERPGLQELGGVEPERGVPRQTRGVVPKLLLERDGDARVRARRNVER